MSEYARELASDDGGPDMDIDVTSANEAERVDAAIDVAKQLVDHGDSPLLAVNWAAEHCRVEHRRQEVWTRVQTKLGGEDSAE